MYKSRNRLNAINNVRKPLFLDPGLGHGLGAGIGIGIGSGFGMLRLWQEHDKFFEIVSISYFFDFTEEKQ